MKRPLILILACAMLLAASCATPKKCPAYSYMNMEPKALKHSKH